LNTFKNLPWDVPEVKEPFCDISVYFNLHQTKQDFMFTYILLIANSKFHIQNSSKIILKKGNLN